MPNTLAPHRYHLEPHDLQGHRCRVTLRIAEPDPAGQVVSMPAWIPGSYLLREFGRQIETLQAYDGEHRAVALHKLDRNTWRAAPCRGALTLTAVIYAWDLSVRGAHLDDSHGFFNGTSLFLKVHGQEHHPCLLQLSPPPAGAHEGQKPWRVYTSLPSAEGEPGAAARHDFGWYRAPDYDALLDHPIEMGTPQVVSFEAHGVLHEMVFTGAAPNLDLDRLARDVRQICEAQIALFEPETLRPPFLDSSDRYVFMTLVTSDGYGGLEHRASTALMTSRKDLPALGQATISEGYRSFLGLVSHEYFHTWHVKRIKPAAFAPYDLARENYSRLLWVFEGFTSYYDDLMLLRAGVIDLPAYLTLLGRTISQVHRAPGRHKQSVAESSFDAWTRYYRQDENSPNALVSYYTKGALIALGLDLLIRQESQDQTSLDDLMRYLWQHYGRNFYTESGVGTGIPENSMPELIRAATGIDVTAFLSSVVDGHDDVPLPSLLAHAGYRLEWRSNGKTPVALEMRTRPQGSDLAIATVYENGNAHRAGLSAHDVVVAVDGLRVSASAGLDPLLQRYQPGDVARFHVFRGDVLRSYDVDLIAPPAQECHVSLLSSSST